MWPTGTAPTGFLLCAGTAVSRSTYAALFAIIGTVYGAGDGSTTFNLPNFTNRSPIGAGSLYAANTQVGSKDAVVVSHTHTFSGTTSGIGDHVHPFNLGGAPAGGTLSAVAPDLYSGTNTGAAGAHSHTYSGTTAATGSSATDANLQPSLGIYFIIKI
jgi:microcystin-dependent protein